MKRKDKKDRKRKNRTAVLVIAGLVAILAVALFVLRPGADDPAGVSDSGQVATAGKLEHNWGYINIRGGFVRHTFTLENAGEEELVLKGAFTSCGCTKTVIGLPGGEQSPAFGMEMPKNWHRTVKPGEAFNVTVDFDPLFHGTRDKGPITRSVYLITSAPPDDRFSTRMPVVKRGTVTQLRVKGVVLSEADFKKEARSRKYKASLGDFRFIETEHDYGVVRQSGGIVKYEFPFIYEGKGQLNITGTPTSCSCTDAHVSRTRLKPGDEGILLVEFDPNFHEEPGGKFFRTIEINTDPPQEERVELRIWVEVDLDLGPEAYKQKDHHDD